MLRAIMLKEWLKLRRLWTAALLVHLGVLLYLLLALRHQFQVEHSEMIWYWAFELRRLLYTQIQFLPALTGAVLAVAQFGPEMLGGRFRLSLHLPVRGDLLVWSWVGFGALLGGLLALLYQARGYQEYDRILPALTALALLLLPAVILPAHRYRHRS